MRKLGNFEQALIQTGRVAAFNIVTLAELTTDIDLPKLAKCLEQLAACSPALQLTLNRKKTAFMKCAPAKPSFENGCRRAKIECELITPTAKNGPLWRACFSQRDGRKALILTINHVLADGTSKLALIQHLLEIYEGAEIQPRQLTENLEHYQSGKVHYLSLIKQLIAHERRYNKGRNHDTTASLTSELSPHLNHTIDVVFSADITDKLQTILKPKRITLNTFLQVALARAVGYVLAEDLFSTENVSSTTSTTMRGFMFADTRPKTRPKVKKHELGALVSMLPFDIAIGSGINFRNKSKNIIKSNNQLDSDIRQQWHQCKELQNQSRALIQSGGYFGLPKLSKYLNAVSLKRKERMGDVALSFSGAINTQIPGLKNIRSYISAHPKAPPFSGWGHIQPDGQLVFCFCYHSIQPEKATEIVEKLKRHLEEL